MKYADLPPIFFTEEKINEIKSEISHIETVILPEIRKRMAIAYEDGDLPENNPWITANDDLQTTMKQRNALRELLMRAKKFEPQRELDTIHLGSSLTLSINGKEQLITLVSSEEADASQGKLSADSPIGKAIIGKRPGDTIEVSTPGGNLVIRL